MDYLIVFYTGKKIFTREIKAGMTFTAGDSPNDTITLEGSGLGAGYLEISCNGWGVRVLARQPFSVGTDRTVDRVLSAGDFANISDKITLAVFRNNFSSDNRISLDGITELTLGRSLNNDIALLSPDVSSKHVLLEFDGTHWTAVDVGSRNGTFVNGELIGLDAPVVAEDVNIFAGGYILLIHRDSDGYELRFMNNPAEIEFAPDLISRVFQKRSQLRYPFFMRSPRIRVHATKAECEITPPPNVPSKPSFSWLTLLLPPFMMVLVMGTVAIFTHNYNMLLYSIPMSMVSVVVSIFNNNNNLKKWKKETAELTASRAEYLSEREKVIIQSEGEYISALSASSPGVIECMSIVDTLSRRLWERTPRDNDFMSIRLGTGTMPSNVNVKIQTFSSSAQDNPFTAPTLELAQRHAELSGVPVCHSFLNYPITGMAAELEFSAKREDMFPVIRRIVMDIAAHHSPEDVKIVCIYPESEKENWDWIRWMPHVWDTSRNKRYIACSVNEARPILREMSDILKTRRRDAKNTSMDRNFVPELPFYFLILADRNLTEASGVQFLPENDVLGFSVMYAYGDIALLPNECQSVIMCGKDSEKAYIQNTRHDTENRNTYFTPDKITLRQAKSFASTLAPVRLMQSGGSSMPRSVSFLQGFNVRTVQDLNIMRRWKQSKSEESLAAPIGIKENGDVFSFDIFEKAMGPHGIAAGTAGSGKSEMLTTLLLSMALTFSPEYVNFALIEFKGNDLSNILKPLPHVAGVVSNLNDPSTIVRGLRSLEGEERRRQQLFEEASFLSTKSIFAYQKYYKAHKHEDPNLKPLPYLIIVIDEFAEMITQYPDFGDVITSIARIGRSIGMYMILTMQSPQGVIKGQVSSNTKFRICLRTANSGESKEIIGTDEAFKISAPGRAIVKVGDDVVKETVQTFYAKVDYNPSSEKKAASSDIRFLNLNGKREKLPKIKQPASDNPQEAKKEVDTEGVAVVKEIIAEAKADTENIERYAARQVWTDPLPPQPDKNNHSKDLVLDELIAGQKAFDREAGTWLEKNQGLAVTVGLVDDPDHQKQYPLVLDFMRDGHQLLFGSPSSGKTTFIQTVLMSAALSYTPDQVNFLIFDYGSFILGGFEALPHCLISANPQLEDKLKKARDFLYAEMSSRRKMFTEVDAANIDAYRMETGKTLPSIIIAIDNISALNMNNPDIMDLLNIIASEGARLGMFLVMTTISSGSYLYKMSSSLKSKHALQMTDRAEYREIVGGNGKVAPGNYKGRGFTQGPLEFQTALFAPGADDNARARNMRTLREEMASAWTGKRASILEEESTMLTSATMKVTKDSVEIGLDKQTREPYEFVFEDMNGCIISGGNGGGKTNLLGLIAQALAKDPDTSLYIFEKEGNTFLEKLCPNAKTVHDGPGADEVIGELADIFDQKQNDENNKKRVVFCVDGFTDMYNVMSNDSAKILSNIIADGVSVQMYVYITLTLEGLSRSYTLRTMMPPFMKCLNYGNAVVAGGSLIDCQAFEKLYPTGEEMIIGSEEACIIHNNKLYGVKMAKVEGV